jgi:ferredoxin-type protein NapH
MAAMAEKGLRRKASWIVRWRLLVQTGFLAVWLDPFMLRLHWICSPVFHCYACPLATFACPIGVVAQFGALHIFPFVAVGTIIVAGAFLGTFICGWVCPFGYLQDLIGKIKTHKFTLPRWTAHIRWAVLIGLVVLVPVFLGEAHPLFICRVCPAGALEGSVPNMVKQATAGETVVWPSVAKTVILVLFLLAIFVKYRPWCTLFCPLGLIFGVFNRFSMFFLRFNRAKCGDCSVCHTICKYNVRPDERANDVRCIRCLDCTRCRAVTFTNVFKRAEQPPQAPGDRE